MPNLLDAIVRRMGGLFDAAEEALEVWDDLLCDDMRLNGADWPPPEPGTSA